MDPSLFGYSVEDFREEAGELLSKAEDILSALNREPQNIEYINALFRAIHSLKGSAAYAGLNDVNTFSHLYESFLGDLRNRKYDPDKDIQKLLVRARDYLEDLIFNPGDTHTPSIDTSLPGSMDRLIKAVGLKSAGPQQSSVTLDRSPSVNERAEVRTVGTVHNPETEKSLLLPKSDRPDEMDQEDVIKITLTKGLKAFAACLKKSAPDFGMLSRVLQKIEETANWAFGDDAVHVLTQTGKFKSILAQGQGPEEVLQLRKNFNGLAQAIKEAILSMGSKEEKRSPLSESRPESGREKGGDSEEKHSVDSIRGATEEDIVKITIARAIETISEQAEGDPPDVAQIGKMVRRLTDINKWAFNEDETVSDLLQSFEELLQSPLDRNSSDKIRMKSDSLGSLFHALQGEREIPEEEEVEENTPASESVPVKRDASPSRQGKHLPAKIGGPSMRVKSADLQSLMNTVSEIEGLDQKTLERLHSQALQLRMVPVGELFNRFRKIVRDISEELQKEIELAISGESVRLDKIIADKLQEPLLHMVRNAAGHGIESPQEREAGGKGVGIIKLAASHEGGKIIIEVSDNGRGIDIDAVRDRGIQMGLIREDQNLNEKEIMDLIFKPGFSTKEMVDGISGRGVGMDVVKDMVSSVQGTVMVESEEDSGTKFRLVLPLTLAIVNALIVKVGASMIGISAASIDRILTMKEEDISKNTFMNKNRLSIDLKDEEDVIPIVSLARIFGGREKEGKKCILLLNSGLGQRIALVVDSAMDRRSLTVKPLDRFAENRFFSSAAVWDKRLVLILNIPSLMEA